MGSFPGHLFFGIHFQDCELNEVEQFLVFGGVAPFQGGEDAMWRNLCDSGRFNS